MALQSTGTYNRDPQNVQSIFQAGLAYPSVYDKLVKIFSQYTLTYVPHAMSSVEALPVGAQKDTWFVKGRREDPVFCTGGYSGSGVGNATATFDVTEQSLFPKDVVITKSNLQLQILDGGVPSSATTGGYTYTYRIATYSSTVATVSTDFTAGQQLGRGWTTFENKSKTGYGAYKQPDSYTNWTSISRRTISIDGTAATQLLYLKDKTGKPMVSFPMQYADEKDSFMYDKEKKLWFAKSNINPLTGVCSVPDLSGNMLPQGDGFAAQIEGINQDSYTGTLTTSLLLDYFYNYMKNASITKDTTIFAVTGHPGAKQWQNALEQKYLTPGGTMRQTIIGGKPVDLGNTYPSYTIGNCKIMLVINPIMDDDLFNVNLNDDGTTKMSNSFYFLNLESGMGTPNLIRKYKSAGGIDRSLIEAPVPGLINPMGSLGAFSANSIDGYEVNCLSEEMIEVMNPVSCGSLLQN